MRVDHRRALDGPDRQQQRAAGGGPRRRRRRVLPRRRARSRVARPLHAAGALVRAHLRRLVGRRRARHREREFQPAVFLLAFFLPAPVLLVRRRVEIGQRRLKMWIWSEILRIHI